ncbi:hypothetical protein GCM10020367_12820 [Streptomyces sannanensis]|uniref:Cytochrome bc1 complex Rieske iron-sulfur subunit n=1 Tax=Streptomyces sannanensis TaxID=285536 RepID=A0ABP6S6Y1_9ACTN
MSDMTGAGRRAVLAAGAAAAGTAALTGCGNDSSEESGTTAATTTEAAADPTLAADAPAAATHRHRVVLAKTSEIPVRGGKIFAKHKVVVTQPKAGTFKAFSAICTHRGCTVNKVVNGTIDCPCHGSKFHIADGSVAHGPAQRPLPAKHITVKKGSIILD